MDKFVSCEENSEGFMASVESALTAAELLVRANVDVDRTYNVLAEQARSVLRTLVVARSDRTRPEVQRAFVALLNRHIDELQDARDGVAPIGSDSAQYRDLLALLSLRQRKGKGSGGGGGPAADALLSFQLTANQPTADELDADDPSVAESLARVRADLRISLLDGDIAAVFALTESEIVAIARKREAHALLEYSYPPSDAFGDSLLLSADEDAEPLLSAKQLPVSRMDRADLLERTLSPLRSLTLSLPTVLAAAHISSRRQHHKRSAPRTKTTRRALAGVRDQLTPLRGWNSVDRKTLAAINRIVAADPQYERGVKKIAALTSVVGNDEAYFGVEDTLRSLDDAASYDTDEGLLQRSPDDEMGALRALLKPWAIMLDDGQTSLPDKFTVAQRVRALADAWVAKRQQSSSSSARSDDLQVQTQRRLLQVQVHVKFVAQLVYLAAMAGSLCARITSIYDFESGQWTAIKDRFERVVAAYELVQTVALLESTLHAVAVSTRLTVDKSNNPAKLYIRIAGSLRLLVTASELDSRNFLSTARQVLAEVRPLFNNGQGRFVRTLMQAADAAFALGVRALAESAVKMAIGAALARGISRDADNERRGIDVYAFADTLHAASDVADYTNFGIAAPVLLAYYPLLITALVPDTDD
jgi:hypothetical protein